MTKKILVFFEDLQNVLGFDVTDDFESFLVDQEEVADNSSNVKFTQVQRDELETVLERIATKSCNIPEEYEIASRLLDIISSNGTEEKVQSFYSVFVKLFRPSTLLQPKKKQRGLFRLSKTFSEMHLQKDFKLKHSGTSWLDLKLLQALHTSTLE